MDTLTKTAEAMEKADDHFCSMGEDVQYKKLTKAAARVILDSPEVMGLVEALKIYKQHDQVMGLNNAEAAQALAAFQKLREMVGE